VCACIDAQIAPDESGSMKDRSEKTTNKKKSLTYYK